VRGVVTRSRQSTKLFAGEKNKSPPEEDDYVYHVCTFSCADEYFITSSSATPFLTLYDLELIEPDKIHPQPGLPDFSWYKIPKREKCTKLPQTIPNVHM
jgi:hypothetical protein